MIVRFFLFFLAMITGFSAAQAAGNIRHTPEMVGSALPAVAAAAISWSDEAAAAKTRRIMRPEQCVLHQTVLCAVPIAAKPPVAATIFVGDRNRQ